MCSEFCCKVMTICLNRDIKKKNPEKHHQQPKDTRTKCVKDANQNQNIISALTFLMLLDLTLIPIFTILNYAYFCRRRILVRRIILKVTLLCIYVFQRRP